MYRIDSLATAWRTKRRKLAPLLVAAAVLLIGKHLGGAIPREVHLRYELGPEHGALREARIGYRLDGEEMKAVRFAYTRGAPSSIEHHVALSPGRYEIVAELRGGSSSREIVRSLEVPADGIVRVELFDSRRVEGHPGVPRRADHPLRDGPPALARSSGIGSSS